METDRFFIRQRNDRIISILNYFIFQSIKKGKLQRIASLIDQIIFAQLISDIIYVMNALTLKQNVKCPPLTSRRVSLPNYLKRDCGTKYQYSEGFLQIMDKAFQNFSTKIQQSRRKIETQECNSFVLPIKLNQTKKNYYQSRKTRNRTLPNNSKTEQKKFQFIEKKDQTEGIFDKTAVRQEEEETVKVIICKKQMDKFSSSKKYVTEKLKHKFRLRLNSKTQISQSEFVVPVTQNSKTERIGKKMEKEKIQISQGIQEHLKPWAIHQEYELKEKQFFDQ